MIKLLHIDCMEYMKTLPDGRFDTIVTSPPYDDLRDYGGCEWTEEKWKGILSECARCLSTGGIMVWIVADATKHGGETGTSFKQALHAIECGLRLHDTMIWAKDSFSFPEANRYPQCFEYMFVFSKGKPKYFSGIRDRKTKYGGTKVHGTWRQKDGSTKKRPDTEIVVLDRGIRFNYWEQPSIKNSKKYNHPAMFPVKIAYDHMVSWTPKGGRVFDPFLGSGSSAIAAHYGGFDFVGCEIDADYYRAAVKRFNEETSQHALQF